MRKPLLWLAAAFSFSPVLASPLVSGDYDRLLVGVDRQGTLTAYFESSTGNGQFSCIFFITGKVAAPVTRVETWFPGDRNPKEVIAGALESGVEKGKVAVRIQLNEEHGGCWNVQPFAAEPVSFTLGEQGGWEAVRVVSAKKAFFHNHPADAQPHKAYVVTGNALRVFETKAGWVRAEYVSPENKRTQGWISERDLFRADSPVVQP